jgi:hypothetical protein
MKYDLSFSVNLHDYEGDVYEECIMVHLGNGVILQFKDLEAYEDFIARMVYMKAEIKENL